MPARILIAILVVLLISIPAIGQNINSQLIEAAMNDQAEKVQALLEAGADVNAAFQGQTVLWLAAAVGGTEIVKILLDAGADVNVKGEDGYTALMYAANAGHTEIVEMLKQAGAKE